MSSATEQAKMRAEVSSGIAMDRLNYFIWRYAPVDPFEREQFQMDLMRIVIDLMRHQGNTLDLGIETGFASMYHDRAMQPLAHFIMKPPEQKP